MTITLKQLLLVLGGILLAIGLILGFMPVKANGIGCGTALTGQSEDAFASDLFQSMTGKVTDTASACEDSISGRRTITFALGIPGALLLAGVALTKVNGSVEAWEQRNP